jgi:hypothetical protein
MLYFPNIAPIEWRQIVVGRNISKDFGQRYYGVDYPDVCMKWATNDLMWIQMFSDITNPNITLNGQSVAPIDITPVGWQGFDGQGNGAYVLLFGYQPTVDQEVFQFKADDGTYFFESEQVMAFDETDDLIKIEYQNSVNKLGYINNGTMTYLTTYIYGEDANPQPENSIVAYDDDDGELTKLQSTPTEGYLLTAYYVNIAGVNRLNMIFSCDDILINGESFQTNETPTPERIENSDLSNVTVRTQRTNNYYMYFTQE